MTSIPKLQHFVERIAEIVDTAPDESTILHEGARALAGLVAQDDWLPHAVAQPSPERYQQYLLYVDPDERFSVVSFVWGPGQETPIHDHTVWGLIGMLRGAERSRSFVRDANAAGTAEAGGPLREGDEVLLIPGQVEAVSPSVGDIHRVRNAYNDRVSISIHIYGADIGKVQRSVYTLDGPPKRFVSGYATPFTAH
jgi:predicted metal-dependent enzyme (double-stranded beta helix superfamily)